MTYKNRRVSFKGARKFRALGMTKSYRMGFEAGYKQGWWDNDKYRSAKRKPGKYGKVYWRHYWNDTPWKQS